MAKTINTVLKLKDQFSSGIKTATKSTKGLTAQTKITEARAKRLATTMKADLARGAKIAAAALVGVGVAAATGAKKLAESTATQLDEIDKMSQKLGISSEAYQKWDYALSRSGADVKNLKSGMKKLNSQMTKATEGNEEATAAFDSLGVSVVDSKGNLRDQEDVFYDTVKGLASMKNESERTALANKLLGKSGAELAPLLNQGADGIDELLNRAEELGLIIDADTVKAGAKLNDTMDDVRDSLNRLGISIGSELIPYFQAFSDFILEHMPEIKDTVKGAVDKVINFGKKLKTLKEHADVLIPVLSGIVAGITAFKVITTVQALMTAWKGAMTAFNAVAGVTNATLFACPLTWIVLGIAAAVAAGVALYRNWDTIKAKAQEFIESHEKVKNAIDKVKDAVNICKEAFTKIKEAIQAVIDKLKEWFGYDGKTVNVTTKNNTTIPGVSTDFDGRDQNATGTAYWKGGQTVVGENGPELLTLPSGSKITPNGKTMSMMSGGSSINVNVNISGNVIGNEAYANELGTIISNKLMSAMGNV